MRIPSPHRLTNLVAGSLLLASGAGCSLFHGAPGTKEHLDAPREHISSEKNAKKHDMLVEVTTDASGEVVNVTFKRSSGVDTIDTHVADTIHATWPKVASTVALAEITFSMADGFSQPKVISSHPAP